MLIKKFHIENYRSLKNIQIDSFEKTTIFYGENNAGKSNILNALKLIFSRKSKLVSSDTLSEVENFYSGHILDSQNTYFNNKTDAPITFFVEVEIFKSELNIDDEVKSMFKTNGNVLFSFEGVISFSDTAGADYSDFKMETIKKDGITIYSNKDEIVYFPNLDKTKKKQSPLEKAFTKLIDVFNDCVYIVGSDRDMHEAAIDDNQPLSISPRYFKNFLYSLYLSPKNFKIFEKINDVYSKSPFNFGTISFSKEGGKLEIMVKETDFRLPIKHLGSGALQALYIIASIIWSKSKIVCLEELEQNLSPKKQFEILKKIKAMIDDKTLSLNQLIISSHSSVYAKPKLGLIYFLEKREGQTLVNRKEGEKISKKLVAHLATTTYRYTEVDHKEMLRILKDEHDFDFGI